MVTKEIIENAKEVLTILEAKNIGGYEIMTICEVAAKIKGTILQYGGLMMSLKIAMENLHNKK